MRCFPPHARTHIVGAGCSPKKHNPFSGTDWCLSVCLFDSLHRVFRGEGRLCEWCVCGGGACGLRVRATFLCGRIAAVVVSEWAVTKIEVCEKKREREVARCCLKKEECWDCHSALY